MAFKPTATGLDCGLFATSTAGLHSKVILHFTSGEPRKQVERSTNVPPSQSPKTDFELLELPPLK